LKQYVKNFFVRPQSVDHVASLITFTNYYLLFRSDNNTTNVLLFNFNQNLSSVEKNAHLQIFTISWGKIEVLLNVLNMISVERNKQKVSAGLGKGDNEQIRECLVFDQLYARDNRECEICKNWSFFDKYNGNLVRASCS